METNGVKNSPKKAMIIRIILVAIVLLVGLGIYYTPTNRVSRQLDLGQRYLEEHNYEQAIVAFNEAIEIDPMSVEAYLGLADAHVGLGDLESAISVLERGYKLTQDENLKQKLSETNAGVNKQNNEPETNIQVIEPEYRVIMEGLFERRFYERDYTEAEEVALTNLIQALQNDDMDGVVNSGLLDLPGENNLYGLFGDYAISIYWDQDYSSCFGDVYSLIDGEYGFSFGHNFDTPVEIIYKIPCVNGTYHGDFEGVTDRAYYSGKVQNGLVITADVVITFDNIEGICVEVREGLINKLSYGYSYSSGPDAYLEVHPTPESCIGRKAYIYQGRIREVQE